MPYDVDRPRAPLGRVERPATLVDQPIRPVAAPEQKPQHSFDEATVRRSVVGRDVELGHQFPLDEDLGEVDGVEELRGVAEGAVLEALDVDLHDGRTELNNVDEVVEGDGVNNWRTHDAVTLVNLCVNAYCTPCLYFSTVESPKINDLEPIFIEYQQGWFQEGGQGSSHRS